MFLHKKVKIRFPLLRQKNTLTKDGLVYELVKTNNGLKEGSATETGKVTEAKQEVVYE